MKIICIMLILVSSELCYSQDFTFDNNLYEGILGNLFINHHPNIRAEAMGRGLSASDNGDFAPLYNPALTSLTKGLKINYSYSQNEGKKPSFNYYEAAYSKPELGSIGISAYYYSKLPLSGYLSSTNNSGRAYFDAVYSINYSREVTKNFFTGVNFNVFHYSHIYNSWVDFDYLIFDDGVSFDAGILKKFDVGEEAGSQVIEAAAAFYNITNSKYSHDFGGYLYKSPLPSIFRLGGSYLIKTGNNSNKEKFYPVTSFTHIELEKIVNSNLGLFIKAGEEITLHEVVSFRAGLFFINEKDKEIFIMSEYSSPQFFWGGGLNVPFHRLFNLKNELNLKIDYARSDFSGYINEYDYYAYYSIGTYTSLGLSLKIGF